MHALYAHELRLFQNLFLPSVKLARKERVGSRLRRRYDAPCTPFERVLAGADLRPEIVAQLRRYREGLDPFALARAIDQQLERIHALASLRHGAPVDPAPVRRPVRQRLSIKPSPHLVARPSRSVTSETAR